ncbi:MAG TPA: SLBB domain-containing protein [Steroidobacteraceae bacterium]|jgi:protein involved in polysaccharide export with SLBB domain|nr:SLBB domain-containing protein [Steroidobacteraceae bacterium]
MRPAIARVGRGLLVLLATTACLLLSQERAESQTPPSMSPELLQIFQGLTPEQQQAIMQQLGSGAGVSGILGALSGGNASGQTLGRSQPGQQPGAEATEEEPAELPGFNAEDWVIVQVEVLPQAPAATAAAPATAAPPAGIPPALLNNPGQAAALGSLLAATATAPPTPTATPKGAPPQSDLVSDRERQRLVDMVDLIRSKNPYRLTREGTLLLPGFAPISLLGLGDDQATLRLSVEPALRGLTIHVTRLPLRRAGVEGLKPFGYDMFGKKSPSTFAPFNNIPVPSDYIVGPGDEINVQLYGNQNRTLRLTVTRDGQLNLPDIGPISVAGQRFTSVKAEIESRVQKQLIGMKASVSMGDTRSIHVYVLGEAKRPGSYTLSALSTVTSSLYAAGGVKMIGSLRAIMLKRGSSLVRRLDLYDLLIRGDNADDAPLMEGDVVFVPPVGQTVSVDGEVRRPAIYELRGESNVAALVQLAGGLTAEADHATIVLTRIDAKQRRVVLPVELTTSAREQPLSNGDVLHVARLRPTLDSGIVVQGYLYAPGDFAWRSGLRLTDVIPSVDQLKPDADLHYVLIRRESGPDRHISVVSVDLAAALAAPGSDADAALMPRDRITVFDLQSGRDRVIQPVLEELRLQGNAQQPTQVVHVVGRVKVPGDYPLEPGMRVSDLIRAGGGTTDAAYGQSAELVRYTVVNGEMRQTDLLDVDLSGALKGGASANVRLLPFDTLMVKEVPEWRSQEAITLRGEVRFPGVYAIRRGETLKSVLTRAGGLTQFAFAEGSVFTRDELKRREQEQLDMLADRMQRDVALLALQSAAANQQGAATALSVGQSLLGQLKGATAVGRLVIDLPHLEESPAGSVYDVVLRDGDTLSVPRYEQQVTVIGEVQTVTSHLYNPRLARDDYIGLSGGVTSRADKGRIYIVRASGSVIAGSGSRWFDRNGSVPIKPGDTIVVPLDTEHIPALPLWTQVTQILYNVAIAVLAIRSV